MAASTFGFGDCVQLFVARLEDAIRHSASQPWLGSGAIKGVGFHTAAMQNCALHNASHDSMLPRSAIYSSQMRCRCKVSHTSSRGELNIEPAATSSRQRVFSCHKDGPIRQTRASLGFKLFAAVRDSRPSGRTLGVAATPLPKRGLNCPKPYNHAAIAAYFS